MYLKIAMAYLLKNKLRFFLLILGVLLSVLLVFSTELVKNTQYKNDIEATLNMFSGYDGEFSNLRLQEIKKLKTDRDV